MNTLKYGGLFFAAAFLLLCRSAPAAPSAATLAAAYPRLTLPCASNAQDGSSALLPVTFNLLNATPHTLSFAWAPFVEPALRFQVDHKAVGDNPNSDAGWKPVKPNPQPVTKPDAQDPVVHEETNRQKIVLASGKDANLPASLGFTLAAPGFYRISLTMTMDAYEYEKPSDTKGRPIRLVLHSDHLIVVKTDSGFGAILERP